MATMTGPRKTISIHDYPEHLNPFREDDNHNKIRFWTIGRKINRSNSISFSGIKDLKDSWAFRSFMKKGKKGQQISPEANKNNNHINGEESPVVFRRTLQTGGGTRSTVGSPERYVYGGSVTPLPRSRFQERLRSPSQHEVSSISVTPRMARSEISGSRLSVESTNPFDESPVPPVRASRRKKKRAPPPPAVADTSVSSQTSDLQINEIEDGKTTNNDVDLNLNVELKIVEDEDLNNINKSQTKETTIISNNDSTDVSVITNQEQTKVEVEDENKNIKEIHEIRPMTMKMSDSEDDILNKTSFPKIDIVKYRRNSSLNEDDIRLRRGNLEDFHSLSNKRSKSLTNTSDPAYIIDIDLDDNRNRDVNSNEEPQKVICKVYDETSRKQSIDNSISSTEKEFLEIDRATRELEKEISKLNTALIEDDHILKGSRLSVSDIKKKFDQNDVTCPNPIPKPRRSNYDGSN